MTDTVAVVKEFIPSVLGKLETLEFLVFLFWGYVGFLFSLFWEVFKKREDIKISGGFSPAYWWKRNWARVALSIVAIPICIRFSEQFYGAPPNDFGSFLLGVFPDFLAGGFAKFKKPKP